MLNFLIQPKTTKLGLFHATMIVMGGIIGSGIFMNPYVVARQVHTPALILGAWAIGGLIALAGAFVYSELASRMPAVGGQYAYLRDAYHPRVAFLYGWVLLLVIQTGGMAAVAVTFARLLPGADASSRLARPRRRRRSRRASRPSTASACAPEARSRAASWC